MPKLTDFSDNGTTCWCVIRMDDNSPIWTGVAQSGVMVKKSRLGILGAKLFNKPTYESAMTAKALHSLYPQDETPNGITNPALKSFANAILHCKTVAEVTCVLNEATSKLSG